MVTDQTGPKIYSSKREIYKDYKIAIKFIPDCPVRQKSNYAKLLAEIDQGLIAKTRKLSEKITLWDEYRTLPSWSFFLQVPCLDDAGKEIGPKFVLLTHETGLEVFIADVQYYADFVKHLAQHHPVETAATIEAAKEATKWVAKQIPQWAAKRAFDKAFNGLVSVLSDRWTKCIDPEGGWKIVRVAIRTENKGVMEMPFSKFKISQIDCLLQRWELIKHLSEVNQSCFGGELCEPKLHDPNDWGETEPMARD
jgi:hypothetical protein